MSIVKEREIKKGLPKQTIQVKERIIENKKLRPSGIQNKVIKNKSDQESGDVTPLEMKSSCTLNKNQFSPQINNRMLLKTALNQSKSIKIPIDVLKATLIQSENQPLQAKENGQDLSSPINKKQYFFCPIQQNTSRDTYAKKEAQRKLSKTFKDTSREPRRQHSNAENSCYSLQKHQQNSSKSGSLLSYRPMRNDIKKWSEQVFPVCSEFVIKHFGNFLYEYEKKEITQYLNIYYIGMNCQKRKNTLQLQQQHDICDDTKGDYKCFPNDHIAYRYEILNFLGRGTFGCVVKVFDHKRNEYSAMKIIKSSKKFSQQAFVEVKMLKYLKEQDNDESSHILKIKDFVIFRNHVCIIFELLSINLYDFLKKNGFRGMPIDSIKKIAVQLLESLKFLRKVNVIHCDLKPENILLKQENRIGIKIVDFGSSCFQSEKIYTYIQSRYYRSPEIILGYDYDFAIDMWSFGTIIVELYLGQPLFPGQNEQEMIQMMLQYIDSPSKSFLQCCCRAFSFFDENLNYVETKRKPKKNSQTLDKIMETEDPKFLDFIKQCLTWEPERRIKPQEALSHPWISDYAEEINSQYNQSFIDAMETPIKKNERDSIITEKLDEQSPDSSISYDRIEFPQVQINKLSRFSRNSFSLDINKLISQF